MARTTLLALALLMAAMLAGHPLPGRAAATVTWTGAGATANWSDAANWSPGLPAPGDALVFPPVSGQLSPQNDLGPGPYAAITVTGSGYTLTGGQVAVTGTFAVSAAGTVILAAPLGGSGGLQVDAGTLRVTVPQPFTGPVQVNGGVLVAEDAAALGSPAGGTTVAAGAALRLASDLALGAEPVTIAGSGPAGAGALQAPFGGTLDSLALADDARVAVGWGTLRVNSLTGPATAALELTGGGKLEIDGGSFAGTVRAAAGNLTWDAPSAPASAAVASDGLLRGTGTLAAATLTGGAAWPGSGTAVGILTVSGPVSFTGGALRIDIAGTAPGSQHSQLRAGTLSLSSTALDLHLLPGYTPEAGDTVTIAEVGTGAVAGAFLDLPEGAAFALGGYRWTITYRGGDGNDVVLRVERQLEADLAVSLTAEPPAYRPGELLTITVTLTNNGPDAAAGPRIFAAVPPGTTFVRVEAPGKTCTTPPYFASSVTCSVPSLEAGGQRSLSLIVRVDPGAAGPIVATAAAQSNTADSRTVNNGASLDLPPAGPGTAPYRRVIPGLAADSPLPAPGS